MTQPLARCGRAFPAAVVLLLLLVAQAGGRAQTSDALPYANGFLLTGNYVVGGVDLPKSGGVGTISFNAASGNLVPENADIVAAYLYWETITSAADPVFGATFRGTPIQAAKASTITSLPGQGANCWGSAGGSTSALAMFRADVLHALPKQLDANGHWTGKYLVNNADLVSNGLPLHTVTLPQQGTGNVLTQSAGATLLLVYRRPDEPLRKVVIYDGAYAQAQGTTMHQTIRGFYQSSAIPSAQITHIVGSGAGNTGDRLLFNGSLVATDPFPSPIDSGADRGWANPTYNVTSLMPGTTSNDGYGETVTTTVDHGANNQNATPYECLAWGAIIFSTAVADVDGDGIPDGLEDASGGLKDPPTPAFPNGQPLPNLNQMGASSGHKDLFVEINAMWAPPGTTYGSPNAPFSATQDHITDGDGHNHLPRPEVLKMVGDVYTANGITPHFDVGDIDAYHALPGYSCPAGQEDCNALPYLVPSAYARGGEAIQERACDPENGTVQCQFPDYPGTVGWRFGLQLHQDAPVGDNGEELTKNEIVESWSTGTKRRRFDRVRDDFFHYLLYAHARGKAKSPFPCLDSEGNPADYDQTDPVNSCTTNNPLFHVPSSASGIADLPGNAALITLGLWDDFLGTPFVQASTTLHELGHNFDLWHGGAPAIFGNTTTPTYVEPNCKPNYLSSMSYLFQVHGLFDDDGNLHLNYSGTAHTDLLEATSLSDDPLFPTPAYQPVWFVPAGSVLASTFGATPATRFCNGAKFDPEAPPAPMARVRALSAAAAIDWNGDGNLGMSDPQDVNFDGTLSGALSGHDDWANLRLDQMGASRKVRVFSNASGDFLDFGSGDFLDFGSGDFLDFGSGDFLDFGSGTYFVHLGTGDFLDFGSGDFLDFGSGDFLDFGSGVLLQGSGDFLDFGSGDFLDFGSGDFLDFGSGDFLDFGSGDFLDFGSGDFLDFGSGTGIQELDYDTALRIGAAAPHAFKACVVGRDQGCLSANPYDPLYDRIQLRWKKPTVGQPIAYHVYRVTGNLVTPASTSVLVGTTSDTMLVDTEELPDGVQFTYYAKAEFGNVIPHPVSGPSNFATVTAVNEAPLAADDSYSTPQGTTLDVAAPGVLENDLDVDSPPAFLGRVAMLVSDPSNGVLILNADGSFTYTPNAGFFGTDSFTYRANDGPWSGDPNIPLSADSNDATVTITVFSDGTPPPPPPDGNYPPACSSFEATVQPGGSVTLNHQCTDADGDPLTVTAVSAASVGTVTLNADGSFTYQAGSTGGTDTFTYTVSDGKASTTATVTMRIVYGFVNVQNLPPPDNKTFNRGATVVMKWQWTDSAGVPLNSSAAEPDVLAYACSTEGKLPGGYPVGDFTPAQPGSGNSFSFSTKGNVWQFNWKLTYTVTDPVTGQTKIFDLPKGTYVVQVKSGQTGQMDPGTLHTCADGVTMMGALITSQ
jgi:hypothetical protein